MATEVPVRPASTVVVLRDGAGGPEAFMVRRHHAIAFMAGAHVFPGGRLDEADHDTDLSWCDLPPATAGVPGPAPAFRIAALRELFEEAGILLARDAEGTTIELEDEDVRARFDRYRHDVHSGVRSLREVIAAEGLRLALDSVVPFARWITPPIEIRRFDTWFFVAHAPEHQQPAHEPSESTDGVWLTPARALALAADGGINLPPPTWATLRELEPFASAADAIRWAASRRVTERQPRVLQDDGPPRIVLPGDPDFPGDEPTPVPFETRFVLSGGHWHPEPRHP